MIDWLVQISDMGRKKSDTPEIDWGAWKKWTLKGTKESVTMAFSILFAIVVYIAFFGVILWGLGYLAYKFLSIFFG